MTEKKDIREWVFTYRSYTPLPFLALMLVLGRPTITSIVAGFVIVLLGECLRFWGVSIVGSETRTTGAVGGTFLITTGPYAYVRNPLYVGNLLLYAGIGVMSMAMFPWLLLVALVWFYVQYWLIVTREEEYLAQQFGEPFAEYCRHVRRFLPRRTPYRSGSPSEKTFNLAEGLASERRTLQAITIVCVLVVVLYLVRG